jgi:outer membrane protein
MKLSQLLAYGVYASLFLAPAAAQNEIRIDVPQSRMGWLLHPYEARYVPPINLSNTPRIESLIRAGNLYLSARDVVALAIENNIDIEIQRYGPLLAREGLRRAESGGALRAGGLGVAPGPQGITLPTGSDASLLNGGSTTSGMETAGSSGGNPNSSGGALASGSGAGLNSAGGSLSPAVGISSSGTSSLASSGGVVTQLGPPVPSFDPTVSLTAVFSHTTSPQSNTFLAGTTTLVEQTRSYQGQYVQNWDFGLSAQLAYTSQYIKVNSPNYDINPFTSGSLDLQVTQNLLQGFGRAVNNRNIRVQKNNMKVTDLQFKLQVITTVAAALNLYWDFVSFHDDLLARKQEVEAARLQLEANKEQVRVGALPDVELTRAEAQFYSSQADLLTSQTNLLQQEIFLKNALSRNGAATSALAQVHIIPLDTIPTPDSEPLDATEELIQQAIGNRVEIAEARINLESSNFNLAGIRNSLKPSLQAFAEVNNAGLTGELTRLGAEEKIQPVLVGGYGNLLAQLARRDFPNSAAGFSLSIPIRNRAAQADYVTGVLQMRQQELALQKSITQVRMDVQSAVVALQQARARYNASVKARELQQQTLEGDRKRAAVRAGTLYQVAQDERDLAGATSLVTQAMANYAHARITLDQVLGRTLEVNHISIEEAQAGNISRPSTLPSQLPTGEKP